MRKLALLSLLLVTACDEDDKTLDAFRDSCLEQHQRDIECMSDVAGMVFVDHDCEFIAWCGEEATPAARATAYTKFFVCMTVASCSAVNTGSAVQELCANELADLEGSREHCDALWFET